MTQLSDYHIIKELYQAYDGLGKGGLSVWPPPRAYMSEDGDPAYIQPASIDLRLGREIEFEGGSRIMLHPEQGFPLVPGAFALGHTLEQIRIPPWLAGRVEGKSTIGRMGLSVHVTAGFIDPGFRGQITLEMKNLNTHRRVWITPGMRICQITLHRLSCTVTTPYGNPVLGSHYQGQTGPTRAKEG